MTAIEHRRVPAPLSTPWLLAGAGLAPVAWLVHIAALPALVPYVCETGARWTLDAATAVLAAVAVVGIVASHRTRRAARDLAPDGSVGPASAYPSERARQWGQWGVVISWGFLALILAEHVPVLVLEACPP